MGYGEFFDYFENINTLEKTIELIKQDSRRYAKRQNTWFKKFGTGKTFSEWNDPSIFEYTEKFFCCDGFLILKIPFKGQ
ncbi:MAG: hypothetical protein IPK25_19475 [Saprospiraceae bacterium]|nr:hypothetical protein [Saprospiraceae bacterium]